jgi:hypothetical protein
VVSLTCYSYDMISGLFYEILGVVFGLVEGLLFLFVGLIEPYGAHCKYVRYADILVLLGIDLNGSILPQFFVSLLHVCLTMKGRIILTSEKFCRNK